MTKRTIGVGIIEDDARLRTRLAELVSRDSCVGVTGIYKILKNNNKNNHIDNIIYIINGIFHGIFRAL